ncbi:MAG: NUDIX domain-containing protein [Phycisphaeraceae bacterium]|nr:NUDIX domain-containing protein [Phycisphaeraceae bacterium]
MSKVPTETDERDPIRDSEEVRVQSSGQEWLVTWHRPESPPSGKNHGSLGICVTSEGGVVLVSQDGAHWEFPAGRPEGEETWEQTLRRELAEEACVSVGAVRLLGFSQGRCVKGSEAGLALVRSLWRADVELQPWEPRFETRHRRVLPPNEVLSHMSGDANGRTFRRALLEAGLC